MDGLKNFLYNNFWMSSFEAELYVNVIFMSPPQKWKAKDDDYQNFNDFP